MIGDRMYSHPPTQPELNRTGVERVLGAMSILTLLMTIPQIWIIWVDHRTAGVSTLSWGAYLVSAVAWLAHGMRKGDVNIYLPCIGWIILDSLVIIGVWIFS